MPERITVREACRRRMSLDGSDAQALEHALVQLEIENAELKSALGNAFVDGAKWWEFESTGGTMWQSDQQKAAEEAIKRKMPFRPVMETALEAKIAELRKMPDEVRDLINAIPCSHCKNKECTATLKDDIAVDQELRCLYLRMRDQMAEVAAYYRE